MNGLHKTAEGNVPPNHKIPSSSLKSSYQKPKSELFRDEYAGKPDRVQQFKALNRSLSANSRLKLRLMNNGG
jgi:hypothetical protein